MKRNYIFLWLLCALIVCAEGAEAKTTVKSLFQRKQRVSKERVIKIVNPDSVLRADSAKSLHVVEVDAVKIENADSVVAAKVEERPYNPYLNLTRTSEYPTKKRLSQAYARDSLFLCITYIV